MDSPFTEKFRPTKPSEWCLPDRIQDKLEKLIKKKDLNVVGKPNVST